MMKKIKTILYISQCTENQNLLSYSLASIITKSRVSNKKTGVSSFLCCHNNYYLQILEGTESEVDTLFEKISLDPRHRNINIIINQAIESAQLEDHPFKVATGQQSEEAATRLISDILKISYPSEITFNTVFDDIIRNKNIYNPDNKSNGFSGKELKLINWPIFDMLSPTRNILELCAMLIRSIDYDSLCKKNPFSSNSELNEVLALLQEMSILELSTRDRPTRVFSNDGFFSKMRSFIGRASLNA